MYRELAKIHTPKKKSFLRKFMCDIGIHKFYLNEGCLLSHTNSLQIFFCHPLNWQCLCCDYKKPSNYGCSECCNFCKATIGQKYVRHNLYILPR